MATQPRVRDELSRPGKPLRKPRRRGDEEPAPHLPAPVTATARLSTAERLSQLTRLLHVTRMLASELDLAEISHQIMMSAIEVIPAADAGTLFLLDAGTGKLHVQDSVGLGPSIRELSLEPGECAAGRAFFSGQGEIYNGQEAVVGALTGASTENLVAFRGATQGLRSPKAAMSAPLIFKGNVLGALVVDKLRDGVAEFGRHELLLLEDLAQVAAIGIMNARLFDLEHSTRLRLEVMNDELNRQRDTLDRRLRALDAMAQVAREGFSLEAIASRLATLACGRATILDGLGRVRASAPPDLPAPEVARRMREPDIAGLVDLVNRDHQRHMHDFGSHQLIASPVMAELEVLGCVMLEASEPEPYGVPEVLVDSAALIASTVFVREQAREEGNLRRRVDLLESLLNGEIRASAAQAQELRPPFRLAVGGMWYLRGPGHPAGVQHSSMLRELGSVTSEAFQRQRTATAVALHDEHVVVAWSMAGPKRAASQTEMFREIVTAMRAHEGWCARFALTEPIDDLQTVPQVYREAKLALEIRPGDDVPVIDVGELGAYRLIIGATSSNDAVESSRRTLQPVLDHDRKRSGNLLLTLRAYLAAGMSVTSAAKALHVHVHTVQYRLGKVEELSRLSLHKSEERLTLELSLRLYDLAESEVGSRRLPGCSARSWRRDRVTAASHTRDNDDTSFRWHVTPNGRLIFGGMAIVTYFTRC
jgi:GAF domain-containing protein